jgi:hypothetical protein
MIQTSITRDLELRSYSEHRSLLFSELDGTEDSFIISLYRRSTFSAGKFGKVEVWEDVLTSKSRDHWFSELDDEYERL